MNRSPTPDGVVRGCFVVECVYFAECSWVISWVLVGYSRNVRNVFVICTLHIRHTKVWFLPCKSMVFGVQKGGFYIAKVWFLFFECYVVANWLQCISWLSVNTSRNRCRYFSAHSLHFG
ncbi:Uncharacterised protein [Prevotella pallens]|uniref:Uncharacterized protein n=1 Tax=Prevotella pallens TaxID=60133 RepID=A0A379G9R0_9BACT|nr:Uncharacterised protein [Prevotella pallens]